MGTESLRTRQAALARQSILETLVRHLEAGDADDVSMDDLATEAGVSRRTLYRYFPARQDLLAASGDWIRDNLLGLPVEIGDEGLAESFRRASAQLESRPHLARALLRTETGRAVRSGYRKARRAGASAAPRRWRLPNSWRPGSRWRTTMRRSCTTSSGGVATTCSRGASCRQRAARARRAAR